MYLVGQMPKDVMHAFALRLSQAFYVGAGEFYAGISLDEANDFFALAIGPNSRFDALSEQLIRSWHLKRRGGLGWSLGGMVSAYVARRAASSQVSCF